MKVLLADVARRSGRTQAAGDEVTRMPDLDADTLPERIAGFEVLIVRSTKVTAAALDQADSLGLIVRAGAAPTRSTVTEPLSSASLCATCRVRTPLRSPSSRWAPPRHRLPHRVRHGRPPGRNSNKKVLEGRGPLRPSHGHHRCRRHRSRRPPGRACSASMSSPSPSPAAATCRRRAEAAGITFVDTLDELLASSDIVSLHVPGSADTKGMVDGVPRQDEGRRRLLNTSRGDVVDLAALIDAMDNCGMRAGLDVYANEPGSGTAEFDSTSPNTRVSSAPITSVLRPTRPRPSPTARSTPSRRTGPANRHCVNLDPVPVRGDHGASSRSRRRARQRAADPQGRAQRLEHAEPGLRRIEGRRCVDHVGHLPSAEIVDEVQALEDVIYISVTLAWPRTALPEPFAGWLVRPEGQLESSPGPTTPKSPPSAARSSPPIRTATWA